MNDPLDGCDTEGYKAIFQRHKTAFLCSRRIPSTAMLKAYKWAQQVDPAAGCIISGFHTLIERDVQEILLRRQVPMIKVCARPLPKRLSRDEKDAIETEKLLIISPFPDKKRHITQPIAHQRNLFILRHANQTIIPYATPNGRLLKAVEECNITVISL